MPPEPYELHDSLDRLANVTATGDVLVTLMVPPNESIGEARQPVEADYAEASALDEKSSPKALLDALDATRSALSEYEAVPENGLVVYAGVPDGDLLVETFDDLPVEHEEVRYDHADTFDLSPIEALTEPPGTHGLLVVERDGAAFGRLDDDGVEEILVFDSDIPGKSSVGGQETDQFERDRDRQKREFFDEVADRAVRVFLNDEGIDGLLLGGTTGTLQQFREAVDLDHRLEDRILGEFTVEYASAQGLEQLTRRGEEAIDERDREGSRDALETFLDDVGSDEIAYGPDAVETALEYDAVETLLLSTTLDGPTLRELGDRAESQGGETVVVPDDSPDGERFAETFDGIGALLRFPVE
jgi:peptide chain release factor subunit 1